MVSALTRRTLRLLGTVWAVLVVVASVALFALGRTTQGVAVLVVGVVALVSFGYRVVELSPSRRR